MKKKALLLFFTFIASIASAQEYNTEKLKIIAEIWGECYLFHPSIIRADGDVNWEKQLVEFLPTVKQTNSNNALINSINSGLLSALKDPFTVVQSDQPLNPKEEIALSTTDLFDYLEITKDILSDAGNLVYLDSAIKDKTSTKPLIIDCRINEKLQLDWHAYTPFHYFASMLIGKEIPMGQSITREHFGWDENNDWWFYEQRWKIAQEDMQQTSNGKLMPFPEYQQTLQQNLPNFDWDTFSTIKRPIYFIANKSFLSYYQSLLQGLQFHRNNTFLIFENSGEVFSGYHGLKKYIFKDFEFILNASIYLNNGSTGLEYEFANTTVSLEQISNFIQSNPQQKKNEEQFSFNISPQKYESVGNELSVEEKLLGIMKVWTIVKYFYPYIEKCSTDWDNALETYLILAQQTLSDKEYYHLIQEMMATLNDSHVSTFHPSLILDFSQIFVAPVQFEWIENKVIVTAIDSSIKADIHIGDEIIAIDGVTIDEILEKAAKRISSSNRQGLLASVINPGYFTGVSGSTIKFDITKQGKQKTIEVPRNMYIFQFMGFGDNRRTSEIYNDNIGYLNLAALTNASDLENELIQMKNTKGLILDLRSSYPTVDYQKFLQMLSQKQAAIRQSAVPIVSANDSEVWQYEISKVAPISSFSYKKPIAVLIDKTMISRPEDVAIALKSFSNVRFVGEQTQGTDGEATKIYLPGGGETSFTGQIIKFGNGDHFQQIGITPDIEVQRTIAGIKNGKDEILDKAIEILK